MIQQVILTTESSESIKPLVEAAIRDKIKLLTVGINRTRERLSTFEKQYSMTTEEFERRFDSRDLKEPIDFIDWSGEIQMLRLLERKYRALSGVRIN